MSAKRIVRFYEMVNAGGERFPNDFPFEETLEAVMELSDDEAYVGVGRLEILGSSYHPSSSGALPAVPLLILDRITRDVRLRIERRRDYRPLILDTDETLAEPTFFSIFPRNVVGIMRNTGSAPGAASFRDYINQLEILDSEVKIEPLVYPNGLRALLDVEKLTKFAIRVGPDVNAEVFGRSRTLWGAFQEIRQSLGSVDIEVAIRMARKGQNETSELAFEDVKELFNSDAFGYMDRAEITYRSIETGRSQTHDFLQEAVATSAQVELSDATSQPTELSAAQALSHAYEELYEDILSALNAKS